MSNGSSHSSVQLGLGGMGTVADMVHTPLQGSVDNFSDLLETPDTARKGEFRGQQSSDTQRPASSLSAGSSSSSQVTGQHAWSDPRPQARSPERQHQTKETYDKYDTASISSLPSYNQVSQVTGS